jgi:hypothetical protein
MGEPNALLEHAHSCVSGARKILAAPRTASLEDSITLLLEAREYLENLHSEVSSAAPDGGELRAQTLALAREIRQAAVLLEQGARRSAAWLDRWRASRGGYTATGNLAAVPLGRVSILG